MGGKIVFRKGQNDKKDPQRTFEVKMLSWLPKQ